MSDNLIECCEVYKSYGLRPALRGVDLSVGPGRIVGLLGPNGSGKTTLIKLLCGLLQPTRGSLAVNGSPIGPDTKAVVSYLPDRMYFADWMKASDLFDLFRDFYADFDYQKAIAMCQSLGVEPGDRLKSMSKGTKEKVQLVLVMAREAKLYLLDEAIFLKEGKIMLHDTVDNLREREGKSVDELFREIFRAAPMEGGEF